MSLSKRINHISVNGKLEETDLPISELPTLLMPEPDAAESVVTEPEIVQKEVAQEEVAQEEQKEVITQQQTLVAQESQMLWPRGDSASDKGLWQWLSLKTKATIAAIAIGTVPLVAIGATAYLVANRAITDQTIQTKQGQAAGLADKINRYMFERFGDIQIIAGQAYFTDSKLRSESSSDQKSKLLEQFKTAYQGIYDSIGVFDLDGNVIAQTVGEPLDNHKNRSYFQAALKLNGPVISQPIVSASTGVVSVYTAAPIKDSFTGRTVAVVRARIPVQVLNEVIKNFGTNGDTYYLINAGQEVFISSTLASTGQANPNSNQASSAINIQSIFPGYGKLADPNRLNSTIGINKETNTEQLLAFAPTRKLSGLPELGWKTIIATNTSLAFETQRNLLLIVSLGTLAAAAMVAAVGVYLANRATRPILNASATVEKIGQGDLEARVEIAGGDEVAVLGQNINQMAGQIQDLLVNQEKAAEQQLAAQAKIAQQQMASATKELEAKEFLQNRALELLMEVAPLRRGDLTIRANVTEDEIGTIADSYNATIGSLRKLVTQVKQAAGEVSKTADNNEVSVKELTTDAVQQSEAIQGVLKQIEQMTQSIQTVAQSAQAAEQAVQLTSKTVGEGDAAMNRTVAGILTIRETVADTAKKVKQLGESSQKISKVVSLIGNFASQTNLLALNASIEAAHAGEEGRGFAVIADEVRSLARQSARATAEIEQLVASIQTETNEVIVAVKAETQQVVAGTQLVEETRQSLTQIAQASDQITALVQAIAQAAVAQSQASAEVSATITDVAAITDTTSVRANQVLTSFQDLLKVAQELQTTVSQFKLS